LEFSRKPDESTDFQLHQQYTYIRQARKHANKQSRLLACLLVEHPEAAAASDFDQCLPLLHHFEMNSAFQTDAARFLDFGQAVFSQAYIDSSVPTCALAL
jgi:hypothetical protein